MSDKDECSFGTHNCSSEQKCVNTDGGYDCVPDAAAHPGEWGVRAATSDPGTKAPREHR